MPSEVTISHYHYLVIDDDAFTLKCLKSLLTHWGAETILSKPDGADAIFSLEQDEIVPDIIICDLNMPELDGVELIMKLAQRKFTGGLILISGTSPGLLDIAVNLARAHRLNVLGTLTKPIIHEELAALLAKY